MHVHRPLLRRARRRLRERVPELITGLLLAAGGGSRMGMPKALVRDPDGTSWLVRGVDVLRSAGCAPVVVVLGAGAEEARPLVPPGGRVVVADDWAEGMAASLRAGLRALTDGDAVAITLVDLPDLTPAVVERVASGAHARTLARATYDGRPGHPVVVGRDHWAAMAASLSGDEGARGYLGEHGVTAVECADLSTGRDQDTPQPPANGGPPTV